MATIPVSCPFCGVWMRVAAQPSRIRKMTDEQLRVQFSEQEVAHICKKDDNGGSQEPGSVAG